MIINTGQRTDIPAFYSEWFVNRIKEGIVAVRNPFNEKQVSRYRLNPDVVDIIGFCTKNPAPMLPFMDALKDYGQYWFVSITPYGRDVEPNVPDKHKLIEDFKALSEIVGLNSVGWRYDPIFITEKYDVEYHLNAFRQIAESLDGYTETVVISFIDLYQKVRRNFPEIGEVPVMLRDELCREMVDIATRHGMTLKPCAEGNSLARFGADCSGCMTISTYEKAIGMLLDVPNRKPNREECACYLTCDIGAYDTCMHLCRYCYANNDINRVRRRYKQHDPKSHFLIGDKL